MRNPTFHEVLDEMMETHDAKNEDYAEDGNPYSNFEAAAAMAGITVDQVFATLIGVKVERLKQLVEREANFESKEDNLLDLAVYATLRLAYYRDQQRTAAHPVTSSEDLDLVQSSTITPFKPGPEGVTS